MEVKRVPCQAKPDI